MGTSNALTTATISVLIFAAIACSGGDQGTPSTISPQNNPDNLTPQSTPTPLTTSSKPASMNSVEAPTENVGTAISPKDAIPNSNTLAQEGPAREFEPFHDGFGFKNFQGGTQSTEIKVQDLIDFFGEDGLCSSGSGEACVPYPGVVDFLVQLNEVLKNGLCYGFSAAATEFFSMDGSLSYIDEEAEKTYQLDRSEYVDHHIARWHMLQFTEEFRSEVDRYVEMSPHGIAEELLQQLNETDHKKIPPMTLALYSSHGAHSVTPLSVKKVSTGYDVSVYDSNWPGQTRKVEITSDGVWRYQGAHENPDDDGGTWEENGPGTMALIPHTLDGSKFHCFFCEKSSQNLSGTGSVMILNSSDQEMVSITVTDKQGNRLQRGHGTNITEIKGAKSYILPGAVSSADTIMVYLPPKTDDFTVSVDSAKDTSETFTLLHAGLGRPTTTIKGRPSADPKDSPPLRITVGDYGRVSTFIDTKRIVHIKQATSKSTTFVEPKEKEIYEASFKEGIIEEVKVIDKETGNVKISLKEVVEQTDLPLRPVINKDGTNFSRSNKEDATIELQNGTRIRSVVSKDKVVGFETQYSDGAKGTFVSDDDGKMVSSHTDGSTSIKFRDGSIIQSTKGGLLAHKDESGKLELFFEDDDEIISIEDGKDFVEIAGQPDEVIKVFEKFLKERTPNPPGNDDARSFNEKNRPPDETEKIRGQPNDPSGKDEPDKAGPMPNDRKISEPLRQRFEAVGKFREKIEELEKSGIESKDILEAVREHLRSAPIKVPPEGPTQDKPVAPKREAEPEKPTQEPAAPQREPEPQKPTQEPAAPQREAEPEGPTQEPRQTR